VAAGCLWDMGCDKSKSIFLYMSTQRVSTLHILNYYDASVRIKTWENTYSGRHKSYLRSSYQHGAPLLFTPIMEHSGGAEHEHEQ
jgi:hypothetical protein